MSYCDDESKKIFNEFLQKNKIAVMSTVGCPACVDAKNLLKKHSFDYSELDLTSSENEKLFNCLYDVTRSHYVPQIFINNKYVGGYRELNYLNNTGILGDLYKL